MSKKIKKKPSMLLPAVVLIILLAISSIYLSNTYETTEKVTTAPNVDVTIEQIPTQERPIVGTFVAIEDGNFVLEINGNIRTVPVVGEFPVAERYGPKLNIISLEDIKPGSEVTVISYLKNGAKLISAVVVENN
jgi:hypothetical protein